MGEICPRSDPDIAHMRYYLSPLKLKYKYVMTYSHNVPLGMGFGITLFFPCQIPIGNSANIDPTFQSPDFVKFVKEKHSVRFYKIGNHNYYLFILFLPDFFSVYTLNEWQRHTKPWLLSLCSVFDFVHFL